MKAILSGVQSEAATDKVALVLAIIVIGDDDDLALAESTDRLRTSSDMHPLP